MFPRRSPHGADKSFFFSFSRLDTVKLDTKAESVEGSWMNPDRTRYMETLTWKSIGLRGEKGTVVTTVGITMTFDKTRKEFKLTGLAVAQLDVDRDFLSEIVLKVLRNQQQYWYCTIVI